MSEKVSVPYFYNDRKWINSAGIMSLKERLSDRIYEIEKKLPNMSLKERQDLWKSEPYWEISKLIVESKDFLFPK